MILFFYGTDVDAVLAQCAALEKRFREKDPQALNLQVFDGSNGAASAIASASESVPFLASSRLVIVKRALQEASKDQQAAIVDWLKQGRVPSTTVVLFADPGKPDKRLSLFKWLQKNAKTQSWMLPEARSLPSLIRAQLERTSHTITSEALEELCRRLGEPSPRVRTELEKLRLHADASDRTHIVFEDVQQLVRTDIQDEIFALTDALARRERAEALRLLHRQLQKGESPLYLLTMLAFQIRNLLCVKDGLERGQSEQQIAKTAGLHPFVVKKTLPAARSFSLEQLQALQQALVRMDHRAKTSSGDVVLALDVFISRVTV